MKTKIPQSWEKIITGEFHKPYFKELLSFLEKESVEHKLFPPEKDIYSAFEKCAFEDVKVVIVGQDPYHGDGQAHGLSFSVSDGIKKPPSLRNIFKEINNDLGKEIPETGSLEPWARQGVL